MICKWMGGWTRDDLYRRTPSTWIAQMGEIMSEGVAVGHEDEPGALTKILKE